MSVCAKGKRNIRRIDAPGDGARGMATCFCIRAFASRLCMLVRGTPGDLPCKSLLLALDCCEITTVQLPPRCWSGAREEKSTTCERADRCSERRTPNARGRSCPVAMRTAHFHTPLVRTHGVCYGSIRAAPSPIPAAWVRRCTSSCFAAQLRIACSRDVGASDQHSFSHLQRSHFSSSCLTNR